MAKKEAQKIAEEIKKEIKEEELTDDMFVGFNEKGEKRIFYKLLEFDSKETNEHYLAYTDNTTDENGNIKAYGSKVKMDGELMKLEPITEEKEWKVIEMALKVLQKELKGSKEGNDE